MILRHTILALFLRFDPGQIHLTEKGKTHDSEVAGTVLALYRKQATVRRSLLQDMNENSPFSILNSVLVPEVGFISSHIDVGFYIFCHIQSNIMSERALRALRQPIFTGWADEIDRFL